MAEPVSNVLYNSGRWDGFAFRDGDIIISTPAKCGTTWTQRIVSLLIFDSPELDRPMSRISPWLDMNTRPLDDVLRDLDAQTHRRFMKSHLAFDLLPHDDRVTYITVGRDPRDVAISMAHHLDNLDIENFLGETLAVIGPEGFAGMKPEDAPDTSGTPVDRFWRWMEGEGDMGLQGLVTHVRSFWDHRDEPNVVVLHYADLQRDLVGQMAYLAERLGIERSRERLEALAPFASFDEMKSSAATTAPNGDQSIWKSITEFFHKGTSGQWRDLIDESELPRYEKRLHALADAEFAAWLERGSIA